MAGISHALMDTLWMHNVREFTGTGNITMVNEGVLIVNKASGAATQVTLSTQTNSGRCVFIKDGKGDASTNPITIVPASGTIDGLSSIAIAQDYGNVILLPDGTNWLVIGGTVTTGGEVGAVAGTGVSVAESGAGNYHTSIFTLSSAAVPVVSVTTGAGVGGLKIYDFPLGHIRFLGCVGDLSIAVATANQADFTDGTPEGDIGIGSVIVADADALGTDATDDDYGTATAFTMSSFVDADIDVPSEAAGNFDGTTTAKDINVNVLVDAVDIDDGTTSEVEVSGTIVFNWLFLGDY